MYEKLKKLLPLGLLKKYESKIRAFIALLYVGKSFSCNLCDFKMSRFIVLKNQNKLCPKCGSLGRSRRLWSEISSDLDHKTVLHFSPPKRLSKKIKASNCKTYVTSDYAGEFKALKSLNIENIEEPNNTYDLIICYHILEHINKDLKAMSELFRILKPGGKGYIQTPFKEGAIYENPDITTPEDRLEHFGQDDHVRIYSAEGLIERLQSVGFYTELLSFKEEENNHYGFQTTEKIIVITKPE